MNDFDKDSLRDGATIKGRFKAHSETNQRPISTETWYRELTKLELDFDVCSDYVDYKTVRIATFGQATVINRIERVAEQLVRNGRWMFYLITMPRDNVATLTIQRKNYLDLNR